MAIWLKSERRYNTFDKFKFIGVRTFSWLYEKFTNCTQIVSKSVAEHIRKA